MARLVIPLAVLPLSVLAVAALAAAALFLTFQRGLWAKTAQAFFRASLFSALYWIVTALVWAAPNGRVASDAGRFLIPVLWLRMVGLAEAVLRVSGRPVPRGGRWLWVVGYLALLAALWPGSPAFFPAGRGEDGLFRLTLGLSPLGLARDAIAAGGWGTLFALLLENHRRRKTPASMAYAGGALLWLPGLYNDVIAAHGHAFLLPFSWAAGILLLAVLGRELHRAVRETYRGLNNDTLTRARSRNYAIEYARHSLRTMPVGLVYLDVDFFKRYNDRLGHEGGDAVLKSLADRVRAALAPGEVLGRIGGDEFLIVIPGARRGDGRLWTSRVRTAVSSKPVFLGPDRTPIPLTVSLGWSFGEPGSDIRALIRRADEAMYREKRLHHREGPAAPREG